MLPDATIASGHSDLVAAFDTTHYESLNPNDPIYWTESGAFDSP